MPTDPRTHRSSLDSSSGLAQERDSLAHVVFALALSAFIACFALWTLWPHDGQNPPKPGIVAAAESSNPNSHRTPLFPGNLPPLGAGRAQLGSNPGDQASTTLAENAAVETLRGNVLDEYWRPVAGAAVWIHDGDWRVLARTDARGAFSATLNRECWDRQCRTAGSVQLGARSADHGPSSVLTLETPPKGPIQLVLVGRGAGLRLEVLDTNGKPLSGVLLKLSPASARLGSNLAAQQAPAHVPLPEVSSDAWGLVRLDGLAPGERQLVLEHAGHSARTGQLSLRDGVVTRRTIEMSATAGLAGKVTRHDRGALLDARVTVTSIETLQEFETICSEDGAFHLRGLPAGRVRLVARARSLQGGRFQSIAEYFLTPGQAGTWNPLLRRVESFGGRLLDHAGQPLVGWRIELQEQGEDSEPNAVTETDEDGRYELPEPLLASGARLLFFNPLAGRGIPTRVLPLEIRDDRDTDVDLDEGEDTVSHIVGRVLQSEESAPHGELMVLYRLHDRYSVVVNLDENGRFQTPAIPPGEYLPVFPRHGLGWAPNRAWRVDGVHDLTAETLLLPVLGQLELLPSDAERRAECFELSIELVLAGVLTDFALPLLQGIAEAPAEFGCSPGSYRLRLQGGEVSAPIEFEIVSGALTTITLPATE